MALGDGQAVPSHTDIRYESSLLGLNSSLECTIRAHGDIPFLLVNQVVELNQIDMVDTHTLE